MILVALALSALVFAAPVNAAASVSIYGYVDKTQYLPGDKGTLKIWVYNDGDVDFILKNVTIEYPWHYAYVLEGNETLKDINAAILPGANWTVQRTFTVPTDGRAVGGSITVRVVTDRITKTGWISINVDSAAENLALQNMEQLTMLFTVMSVLLIVCTVIIAATMYLTVRRPHVTWEAEEKPK